MHATATQVVNAVTDQATAGVLQQASTSGNGFEAVGAAFGAAMVRQLAPVLVNGIATAADSAIAGRTDSSPIGTPSIPASVGGEYTSFLAQLRSGFAGGAGAVTRIGQTRRHGDSANVDLYIRADDIDTTLVLTVAQRHVGDRWRVVGLENITQYIASRDAIERQRLATVNAPILARLASMVRIGEFRVTRENAGYFSEYLRLRGAVRNASQDTVVALLIRLDGPSVAPDNTAILMWGGTDPAILPGTTQAAHNLVEYNQFMDGQRILAEEPGRFTPRVARVVVRRGARTETIAPFESWSAYRAAFVRRSDALPASR